MVVGGRDFVIFLIRGVGGGKGCAVIFLDAFD